MYVNLIYLYFNWILELNEKEKERERTKEKEEKNSNGIIELCYQN